MGSNWQKRQIENQWNILKDSRVNAAKEMLPCKKKETKQSLITKYILEKMRERKNAKSNIQAKYNKLGKEIEMDAEEPRMSGDTQNVKKLKSSSRNTRLEKCMKR